MSTVVQIHDQANNFTRTESHWQYLDAVNPYWVRVLKLLQMDVRYERCIGTEMFTTDGQHILDFLSQFAAVQLSAAFSGCALVGIHGDPLGRALPVLCDSRERKRNLPGADDPRPASARGRRVVGFSAASDALVRRSSDRLRARSICGDTQVASSHRRLSRRSRFVADFMLLMDHSHFLQHRTMKTFAVRPRLFADRLAMRVGQLSPTLFAAAAAMLG